MSAPSEITSATEPQRKEIGAFLAAAFTDASIPAVLTSPQLLTWKACVPRQDWLKPRSYILRQADRTAEHACVWPTGFRTPSGDIGCSRLLDWAADPAAAGARIAIYRHLRELTQARHRLSKTGFKPHGTFGPLFLSLVRSGTENRIKPHLIGVGGYRRSRPFFPLPHIQNKSLTPQPAKIPIPRLLYLNQEAIPMSGEAAILHLDHDTPKDALPRLSSPRFLPLRRTKNMFLPSVPLNSFFMCRLSDLESSTYQPATSALAPKPPFSARFSPFHPPLSRYPRHTRSTLATSLTGAEYRQGELVTLFCSFSRSLYDSKGMDHQIATMSVSSEITPATEPQRKEIGAFLAAAFTDASIPAVLTSPQLLEWKAFVPRQDWLKPRSYILRQDDRIAAHTCIWPTGFRTPSGDIGCSHLLDWAADPAAAGAGITIYRHLMELTDTVLAIGGSSHARRLLPKIGFKPYGTFEFYGRVIRPFRQYRQRPRPSPFREIARLGRNIVWSLPPSGAPAREWSCARVDRADTWLDAVVSQYAPKEVCPGRRSSALINYLLDCPAATCSLYSVACNSVPRGYFILNEVRGQTRIVDMFLNSEEPACWESACRLALKAAASLATTCEVVAATSLPEIAAVFRSCGFRKCNDRPMMLYDSRRLLANAPPLRIQMVDSDAFYMHDLSYPFLT
jgi:hypothetical protein